MNYTWPLVLNQILDYDSLPSETMQWAMSEIMSGNTADSVISAFIYGLRVKGITETELLDALTIMKKFALPIDFDEALQGKEAVDIVGTGGDGHNTVNISTMAALLLASSGQPVIKHGNRKASSQCGGADMLEALGIPLEQSQEELQESVAQHNFAFLFAKEFHPAMRFAVPARSALKVPTIFNLLGPLSNPAHPRFGLIGCAFADMMPVMARAYAHLDNQILLVRGQDGLDEVSISSPTDIMAISSSGSIQEFVFDPHKIGMSKHSLEDIRGGDAIHNSRMATDLFAGKAPTAIEDAVLLNGALALLSTNSWSSDFVQNFDSLVLEKMEKLREHLHSGAPLKLIKQLSAE